MEMQGKRLSSLEGNEQVLLNQQGSQGDLAEALDSPPTVRLQRPYRASYAAQVLPLSCISCMKPLVLPKMGFQLSKEPLQTASTKAPRLLLSLSPEPAGRGELFSSQTRVIS